MYVAIELISRDDGTFSVNTFKKETRDQAEQAFHSILSSAAVSSHPIHGAVILNAEGARLKGETYKHEQAPAPEPEETEQTEGDSNV